MNSTQHPVAAAIRTRVRFAGRVQGVGFRATARDTARQHDVTGWVCNEPCGTVLLEAQGEPAHVFAFIEDLRTRMDHLISSSVQTPATLLDDEHDFSIQRDTWQP
ncbi:MAG: acylphosphatase [Phycisphaeraceae bacterium]|nr:acylphosphatase [Phycisphaeraceae bacterium]